MKRPQGWAALAPALASGFALAAGLAAGAAPMDSLFRHLAGPAGFRAADFDLTLDYKGPDLRPLPAVDLLLRDPRRSDSLVPALRSDFQEPMPGGMLSSSRLWPWLGVARPADPPDGLEACLKRLDAALRAYAAPLQPGDLEFLRRELPRLLRRRVDDTLLTPVQIDSLRRREDAAMDRVVGLHAALPAQKLAEAAAALDAAWSEIAAQTRREGPRKTAARLRALSSKGIPVSVGTEGNDVHRLDRGIVFDPGGDDRYEFPSSPRPGSWLLVVDAGGDDIYRAADTTGGAAAFLSAQAVADLGGDDRYLGGDFAFASALMGYARLFDAAGDDVYEARNASLGFAFLGMAVLEDAAGHDLYSSYFFSQGAAGIRGLAALVDRAGNDRYLSRPVFVDDLRYKTQFLSLSQGFSTGYSPAHPGGIGLLWDQDGEDLYSSDIFGQGAGYWFGWGLLLDDAGNDKYLAHQYAQGAGVHFAAGVLWDRGGDDLRVSKGVSQGCGHDGAFGLLVDEAGDDRHLAVDMSLGAGSANGLGVFLDFAGDDFYEAANTAMALGHADMRRDRGSLGFFLDLGGKNRYPQGFRKSEAWHTYDGQKRGHGLGLDAEP